ncbi:uncharacterized protein LOC131875450 [Cryptomeria japonica]|uniref:uncharacterized protein LOC131875450 n=1 Tax=Cryptomeria japonica TaxID=3369 RepID=UPI0027DA4BF2|nr:uncharacterized protein LOC131875450 [Cryptomeria japonica]XP_059075757.1 uncharacterized protein LOC131875450 [Cryptomeria japonica]
MRSYPRPIFPPDHPTDHPGPWRHGDRDEDQGSRSEEPEEGEGHEEAGDPDPPTGDQPSAEEEEEEEEDTDRDEDEEDAGEDADEDEDEDDEEEEEEEEEEDRDDEEGSDAAPHHSGDDTIALDPPFIPQKGEHEAIRRPVSSTVQSTPVVHRLFERGEPSSSQSHMLPYHDPYWREGDPANVQEWRSLIQQAVIDISTMAQISSSSQIAYRPQGNAGQHEDLFSPFRVQVDIWRERERETYQRTFNERGEI